MRNITEHFLYSEMWGSKDFPKFAKEPYKPETLMLLHLLCRNLEKIRSKFNMPIIITSGYRNEELNREIAKTKRSLHMLGMASDFTINNKIILYDIFKWIKGNLEYSELFIYVGDKGIPINIHYALPALGYEQKSGIIRK